MSIGIKELAIEREEKHEKARKIIHYLMSRDTVFYTKEELEILMNVPCTGIIVDAYDTSCGDNFPILRRKVIRPNEREYDWQDSCKTVFHYGINSEWLESQWEWIEQWNKLMSWLSGSRWHRFWRDKPSLGENEWSWFWELEHPEKEDDDVIQ